MPVFRFPLKNLGLAQAIRKLKRREKGLDQFPPLPLLFVESVVGPRRPDPACPLDVRSLGGKTGSERRAVKSDAIDPNRAFSPTRIGPEANRLHASNMFIHVRRCSARHARPTL